MNPKSHDDTYQGKASSNDDFSFSSKEVPLHLIGDGTPTSASILSGTQICQEIEHAIVSRAAALLKDYTDEPSLRKRQEIAGVLSAAIQTINGHLYSTARRKGSTKDAAISLDILLLLEDHALMAHVGDTRSHLLQGDHLWPLTRDDNWLNYWEKSGESSQESRGREGALELRNALGLNPAVDIHFRSNPLLHGDRYILTSSGLQHLSLVKIKAALSGAKTPQSAVSALLQEVKEQPGPRNATVLCVDIEHPRSASTQSTALRLLNRYDIIRKSPFFSGLSEDEGLKILSIADLRLFQPQQFLTQEGQSDKSLLFILNGEAEIRSKGVVRGKARPGDLIGEMAAFDDSPRTATVMALQPTMAMVLGHEQLTHLLRGDAQLGNDIYRAVISEMIRRTREREAH